LHAEIPTTELITSGSQALLRIDRELQAHRYRYGLIIHVGYCPWYVTKIFRDATPEDKEVFCRRVAYRTEAQPLMCGGVVVVRLKTIMEVEMPTGYD